MNDCPNGDIRDLLPDLLHDRLDAAVRRTVDAHLVSCADCRAELTLLRTLSAAMRMTPALDLAAITAAVPRYRAPVRRFWRDWRIAASLVLLAAGSASVAVVRRGPTLIPSSVHDAIDATPRASSASAPMHVDPRVDTNGAGVSSRPAVGAEVPMPGRELASSRELHVADGSLGDLSEEELTSLLRAIETLDVLPATDVESSAISPIAPARGGA